MAGSVRSLKRAFQPGRAAPRRAARPGARARKGRAGARPSSLRRGLISLVLIALLGAAHWLGLFPRTVDALSGPPARYDVTGTARAVDGDTLHVGSARIRLNGIDAPEKGAFCTLKSGGKRIACGAEAGRRLAALVEGRTVRCVGEGFDRYGRTLANCWIRDRSDDVDIARRLVRTGWALAYRRYSHRYALDETRARLDGLGLWAMDFQNPEEDRHDGDQLSLR